VWISHDPSSASSWKAVKAFRKTGDVTAVACASAKRCFVAAGGDVYTSGSPASARAWQHQSTHQVWGGILSMISCPGAHLCVGGDQFGDIGVVKP
jgi:hypothetical protein